MECKCCDSQAVTTRRSQAHGELHLCASCAATWDAPDATPTREWNQAMGCWVGEEVQAISDSEAIAEVVNPVNP